MPSVWVQHVKAYYQARKKKDAAYKYKDAMKDARATYKKKGLSDDAFSSIICAALSLMASVR